MFEERPPTDQTWTDLEELFSQRGGSIVRGCWCIYYRKVGPVGISPREDYRRLERSRVMKAVDDTPVWSIVCTYVAKAHRGKGYQHKLLAGAIDYARDQGVGMLESYPVDKPERSHDDFMFFGSHSLYARAGFNEVVRRSPTRDGARTASSPQAVNAFVSCRESWPSVRRTLLRSKLRLL